MGRDKKGAMHKCSTIFTPYYLHMYLLLHIHFLQVIKLVIKWSGGTSYLICPGGLYRGMGSYYSPNNTIHKQTGCRTTVLRASV